MYHIVVLGDYEKVFPTAPKVQILETMGCTFSYYHDKMDDTEVMSALQDADIAVVVRERAPMSKQILSASRLKMISQTGTGLAHIDLEEANARGIKITSTPGASAPSVVELTFGLMIACSRSFTIHQQNLDADRWMQFPGFELHNKRLGLLGFGEIAKEVSKVAKCLGMEVVAWRPTGKKGDEEERNGVKVLPLEEVLTTADIVSVHVRLVPPLKGFLNEERLNLLKSGGIFINTARGALVDTNALVRLLKNGHLLGAGIDTFTEEPLTHNPYRGLNNVVLTPHIGYVTWDVLKRFADVSLQHVIDAVTEWGTKSQ